MMFRKNPEVGNTEQFVFLSLGTLPGTTHGNGARLSNSAVVWLVCSYVPDFSIRRKI